MPTVKSFSAYNGGLLYGTVWNLGFDISIYNDLDKDVSGSVGMGSYERSIYIKAKSTWSGRSSWSIDVNGKTSVTFTAWAKLNGWSWSQSITFNTSAPPPPAPVVRKVTLNVDKVAVKVGEEVNFYGSYTADTTPIANNVIRLYPYPLTSGDALAEAVTDKNGNFSIIYSFKVAGKYTLWVVAGYDEKGNPYTSNTVQIGVEEAPPPPPEVSPPPTVPITPTPSPSKINTYIQLAIYPELIMPEETLTFYGRLMEIGGIPNRTIKVYCDGIEWLNVITKEAPPPVGYFSVESIAYEHDGSLELRVDFTSPMTHLPYPKEINTVFPKVIYVANPEYFGDILSSKIINNVLSTYGVKDVDLNVRVAVRASSTPLIKKNSFYCYKRLFSFIFEGDETYNPSKVEKELYVFTTFNENYCDGLEVTKLFPINVYQVNPDGTEIFLGTIIDGKGIIVTIINAKEVGKIKFKFVVSGGEVNIGTAKLVLPKGEFYTDWITVKYIEPSGAKEIYICPICGARFDTKEEFYKHLEEAHKDILENTPEITPIVETTYTTPAPTVPTVPEIKPEVVALIALGLLALFLLARRKKK
jgi:hypothetical protein